MQSAVLRLVALLGLIAVAVQGAGEWGSHWRKILLAALPNPSFTAAAACHKTWPAGPQLTVSPPFLLQPYARRPWCSQMTPSTRSRTGTASSQVRWRKLDNQGFGTDGGRCKRTLHPGASITAGPHTHFLLLAPCLTCNRVADLEAQLLKCELTPDYPTNKILVVRDGWARVKGLVGGITGGWKGTA